MTIKNVLAGLLLFLFPISTMEAKEWRGIIHLYSPRLDVERLLGKTNVDCLPSGENCQEIREKSKYDRG
jgi:hypothetical protein